MPKAWPSLCDQFEKRIDAALTLVGNTEALWLTSPPTSYVRKQLKVEQLEALYEAVFLRVFGYWESFLEEVTLRWMANYVSPTYSPVPVAGGRLYGTVIKARAALYYEHGQQRDYLLWHSPGVIKARVTGRLVNCPIETLCDQESVTLTRFAAVRHHIAHGSSDTRGKFVVAATALTGSSHSGKPGRLLRAPDISDPLNTPKWIRSMCDQLKSYAATVAG